MYPQFFISFFFLFDFGGADFVFQSTLQSVSFQKHAIIIIMNLIFCHLNFKGDNNSSELRKKNITQ